MILEEVSDEKHSYNINTHSHYCMLRAFVVNLEESSLALYKSMSPMTTEFWTLTKHETTLSRHIMNKSLHELNTIDKDV